MGCNCGSTSGASKTYTLVKADGTEQKFLTRTEAVAAMSVEPRSKVVTSG